jgi:hypothetical protein
MSSGLGRSGAKRLRPEPGSCVLGDGCVNDRLIASGKSFPAGLPHSVLCGAGSLVSCAPINPINTKYDPTPSDTHRPTTKSAGISVR